MYDLMAKDAGVPVWQLFGQQARRFVPVGSWTVSSDPTHMAEAVGHNWSKKEQRVTHYDMKLSDGTVLESVAVEDIQVTSASLAEGHGGHMAKRSDKDKDPEKELAEIVDDETVVNEVLRRVVERLSNKK